MVRKNWLSEQCSIYCMTFRGSVRSVKTWEYHTLLPQLFWDGGFIQLHFWRNLTNLKKNSSNTFLNFNFPGRVFLLNRFTLKTLYFISTFSSLKELKEFQELTNEVKKKEFDMFYCISSTQYQAWTKSWSLTNWQC